MAALRNASKCSHTTCMLRFFTVSRLVLNPNLIFETGSRKQVKMKKKMRVMSQEPSNAETPNQYLRSWITANKVFFGRNQGQIPEKPIPLSDWSLTIEGEVNKPTLRPSSPARTAPST